jgi:F420-non-reducing hydrogenase iron-sulfur subunit
MVSSLVKPVIHSVPEKTGQVGTKLTVFHCLNVLSGALLTENSDYEINSIKMPCSSMTREIFLLKAFEDGADGVVVLVCPEGACRYVQGNIRAKKRVERVKKILDEIGLDGKRLNIYNVPQGDKAAVDRIIKQTVSDIAVMGPNPAA